MGYEIPGGIGVKLAEPERDVVVMIGDGAMTPEVRHFITEVLRVL
jgi:3D-(3,5/4)-trihydroxycyclohexane-1,2-dione acylhydrolase (decyclizing)